MVHGLKQIFQMGTNSTYIVMLMVNLTMEVKFGIGWMMIGGAAILTLVMLLIILLKLVHLVLLLNIVHFNHKKIENSLIRGCFFTYILISTVFGGLTSFFVVWSRTTSVITFTYFRSFASRDRKQISVNLVF